MKKFTRKYLKRTLLYVALAAAVLLSSCSSKDTGGGDDDDAKVASQTPVTVINVVDSTLTDYTDLNATSTTLQKN